MKFSKIYPLVTGLLLISQSAFAATDLVACDLFDEPTVSSFIGAKIKQHHVNRQKETYAGATSSTCIFFYDRYTIRVYLYEYASSPEAAKVYADGVQSKPIPGETRTTESGLGDKAFWYRIDMEQFGYTVLKGNRLVAVKMDFKDRNTGAGVKERSRPMMQAAVRKI